MASCQKIICAVTHATSCASRSASFLFHVFLHSRFGFQKSSKFSSTTSSCAVGCIFGSNIARRVFSVKNLSVEHVADLAFVLHRHTQVLHKKMHLAECGRSWDREILTV